MTSANRRIYALLRAFGTCMLVLCCAALANAANPGATAGGGSSGNGDSEYRLGTGDSIRIIVYQNPDLTLETRVSEGGDISYPLVGSLRLGGLTISAAEQLIEDKLEQGQFVRTPQVNIQVLQVKGNQISVLGYVGKPGRYPLETFNTRLLDMIATAGGIIPETGSDIIVLTGVRDGKPFRKEIDTFSMLRQSASEAGNEVLMPGDTIYVPKADMYYIYGESQRPGSYRIERNMTIRQALAMGGGPTPRGTESWVRLDRMGADGKIERLSSVDLDDPVKPNDVIYVRESLF